jgi:uncharacterized YkwD family protein
LKNRQLFALSAVLVLGLAACNNNNDEAVDLRDNKMTTLGERGTGYWDNDTENFRNQHAGNEDMQNEGENQKNGSGTSEILQMPNGFITVDPNSYSTGTPSTKYPHTEMNQQGRMTYRQWQQQAEETNMREQLKYPPQSRVTPGQHTTPGIIQAPAQNTAPAPQQEQAPSGTALSAFELRVVDLTNEERRKNGLQILQPDTALSNVAQEKSNDMQAKNYFSHTSPTYGSPFDMMRDFGVTYRSAGENIAMGQRSAEEVVNAWMNSEGHRKNILSPNFTHIGVGHSGSGNYWTQMFIGK